MVDEKKKCWFCDKETDQRFVELRNETKRIICSECKTKADSYALNEVQWALPK